MLYKLSFQINDSITGRSPVFMIVGDISSVYRVFSSLSRDQSESHHIAAEVRPILPGGDQGEVTHSHGVLLCEDRVPPC